MSTTNDILYHMGGVPVHGEFTTGSVFFVDSVAGSDGNTGKKPSQAFATLDKATNSCTANKNDIVYIMPNHAETISSSAIWVPDVAGVRYIGIGLGADAPELTFSATTSKIIVSGGNNLFQNIRFVAGVSAVVLGVDVTAHHVTFDGCTWDFSTTAFDFVWMLACDSYDYLTVKNCRFIAENATAGADAAIRLDAADHCTITHNHFSGDFALAPIMSKTTDAAGKSLWITDNGIYNDDTGSTYGGGIALRCAFTGTIARNTIAWLCKDGESDTAIDPGSCLMFENYVATAIDEYGVATLIGTGTT
jgi:hypothetical protein